jgi:hypothetical protein
MAGVRQDEKQNSAGADHAQQVLQSTDWIFHVLEDMIGDDKIERLVSKARQRLRAINDIDLRY